MAGRTPASADRQSPQSRSRSRPAGIGDPTTFHLSREPQVCADATPRNRSAMFLPLDLVGADWKASLDDVNPGRSSNACGETPRTRRCSCRSSSSCRG